MEEILQKINSGEAKEIGQGPWVKNSCFLVYEVDGKFYTIIMEDQMNCWLMDETLEEIQENEVEQYI